MRTALLLLALSLSASAAGDFDVLLDFEKGEPAEGWAGRGLSLSEVRVEEGKTPSGGRALTLSAQDDGGGAFVGYVYRPIPESDWSVYDALTFFVKAKTKGTIEMRLLAFSGGGNRAMLHRFTLTAGGWRPVRLPLRAWRENIVDFAGDFRKVIGFTIRWDRGSGAVTFDDFRLVKGDRGGESCRPTVEDRLAIAFPDGKGKALTSDHFLLLTNAIRLKGKDGRKLLERLERVYELLDKRFALSGRMPGRAPIVIFRKEEQYRAYFPRLGEFAGANIPEPRTDGFSVLDVAGSYYTAKDGWERPVFVHEAAHVVIRLRLNLRTNGNWIQEGLANAVQLAIYPESAKDVDYGADFRALKEEKGPFLPLSKLLALKRPETKRYAQLAAFMHYLADRHAPKLVQFWMSLPKMEKPVNEAGAKALVTALGQSLADLEQDFLTWGIEKYGSR